MRDLPERHRSIRAVFDHSWKRLMADEQQVMCQLSVFQGGFQRQAAEQVAGTSLSILSNLVNRTLLRRVAPGRYGLHELIRQYSAEHLAADPRAHAAAQKRHYAYYLALAETANEELKGPNQLEWLERLEQDHSNLRVALEWALKSDRETPGEDRALRLAGALRWFWRMRGHIHEGGDWLIEALQTSPERPTTARASALLALSMILNFLGNLGAARLHVEECAAIFRELGNQRGLAEALSEAGAMLIWQGEATLGQARIREALAIFRNYGNRWGEAQALFRLGWNLADYGGDPAGRVMLEESAAILEKLDEKYLYTSVLISLGIVELGLGDYATAQSHFEGGLVTAREIRHPLGIADALTNLGCLFRIKGEYATAQSRFEESLLVYQEHGYNKWQTDVHCAMAENAIAQGDFSTAHSHLQTASSLLGSSENKWLQVLVLYFRGLLAYYEGEMEEAARELKETTTLAREGQFKPDFARSLVTLGRVRLALGEVKLATDSVQEGLRLSAKFGHKLSVAIALEALANVSVVQSEGAQAVMLFATAHTLRETLGAPLPPIDREKSDAVIAATRLQLGGAIFADLWACAAVRPYKDVVEEILKAD
jgi:tetratricopeptide (TPR) repeat protein